MNTEAKKIKYPAPPSDKSVTDQYFDIVVSDPYRPLENDTAPETLAWVDAENVVTQDYLKKIPFRDKLRKRLEIYNNYPKESAPWKERDGYYYFYKNNGLQNQSVLYRVRNLGDEPEVFIDPNTLSDDGTVALKSVKFSKDGKYAAYSISRSGSDWIEYYVMDPVTKQLLPDHIEWAKFSGARWKDDGFFYSAYARPEAGKEFSNANENHRVYYHKIGTPQQEDILVYEDLDHPLYFHTVYVTDDESLLVLYMSGAGIGNGAKVKDLTTPDAPWVTISESQDVAIEPVGLVDGKLYIYTTKDAPRGRLVATDPKAPQPENWVDVVPETNAVLTDVTFAGDKMLLTYDQDASNHAYLFNRNGEKIREIALPTFGTVSFTGKPWHNEVFYKFDSFTYPGSIYSYDMATGESRELSSSAPAGFNPDDYITEQIFVTSADGTKVPAFIVYRKGLKKDGKNPTLFYGYGGFNISLNPYFSSNRLAWLENGGIYVQANLRGGAEYGEDWHLAGTKQQKLNVFNDMIAVAEQMVKDGWTSPEKMAIMGGSNGGLLVGAVTNMRPDLFAVAIPQVGVLDMMRYHLFTIGWNWASDYGTSADSPEMAAYLLDYSPIHNIRNDGTPYPAIMMTTADHDDRVVPAHSFKYAAALQAANTGRRPKLIRIDKKAGHGAGKPISKVMDEYADVYSFIFYNMGVKPKL